MAGSISTWARPEQSVGACERVTDWQHRGMAAQTCNR